MQKYIRVLAIQFDAEIQQYEVACFRGAVLKVIGDNVDVLFHNHEEDGLRYSYPLIQYKRINKKAAIVCVEEGTEVMGQLLMTANFSFDLGERHVNMNIEKVIPQRIVFQTWNSSFQYRIRKWLPLNGENYKKYTQLDSLSEKLELLENILVGNILSIGKGLGIQFESNITCKLSAVGEPYMITYKGTKIMAFDVEFKSNVSLPEYIGIGRHASMGYGILTKKKEQKKQNNDE